MNPARLAALGVGILAGRAARGPSLMPWPDAVRNAFPWVIGASSAGAMLAVGATASAAVRGVRGDVRSVVAPSVLTLSTIGAVTLLLRSRKRFMSGPFREGRSVEAAFDRSPVSSLVTGSVESRVSVTSLGREGARFVHAHTTSDDVAAVLAEQAVADPIRVFIGYDAAPTVEERVALAMAELDRTDAWNRGSLLVLAPAGTGYANSTPVDALEILTRGDCATVVIGYGLLPSFLSMDRTEVGARTQRALLHAIIEHGFRGRLLLYGESLGAYVQQAAFDERIAGHVDRVLWVGTPGGGPMHLGATVRLDDPRSAPAGDAGVWLLEHRADPVVRLQGSLAWRRPDWLTSDLEPGRGIPSDMRWYPLLTYAQVIVDTMFATDIRPGDFQRTGHDYRADLAAMTCVAFDFAVDAACLDRLDAHLRSLEAARAARIDGVFNPTP